MTALRSVFEQRVHLAPIGIREFRFGPWRLRWGGGWYRVGPLSLLRARQVAEAIGLLDPDKAARLVGADPVALLRPFLHLLIDDLNPRHLAKASSKQVADAITAVVEANDFPAIVDGFGRLVRDRMTIDALAIKLAQVLHLWPGEIVHRPAQEVFAVVDELGMLGPPFRGVEAGASADFIPKVDNERTQ